MKRLEVLFQAMIFPILQQNGTIIPAINLSGEMNRYLNNFRLNDFVLTGENVNIYTPNTKFKRFIEGNFNIVTNDISTNFTYPALRAMVPSL